MGFFLNSVQQLNQICQINKIYLKLNMNLTLFSLNIHESKSPLAELMTEAQDL